MNIVCRGHIILLFLNPLPDDKILALSKLKAFADDKLYVTQKIKIAFYGIENIVEKGEKAEHKHFLLFPLIRLSFVGGVKRHHCLIKRFSNVLICVHVFW